jgi:nucleoside 2-deoxyribosyltransferase
MPHLLQGRRVYLAGPRTWLDREVWAPVEATLLELGLIDAPAEESFRRVAKALRSAEASVFSPFEHAFQLGPDGSPADSRAGRAADAAALHGADLVVILDGWSDVPGAVDAAVLVAATRGISWAAARTVLRAVGAEAFAA